MGASERPRAALVARLLTPPSAWFSDVPRAAAPGDAVLGLSPLRAALLVLWERLDGRLGELQGRGARDGQKAKRREGYDAQMR